MMLSILEPLFLLLIVITHHPLNTFGGTIHEESSMRHLSEAVQKLQNEIELLKKDHENIRRLSEDKENIPVCVEQSKFNKFLNDDGSQREDISSLNHRSNEDNVVETPTDSRNYDKHFNWIRNCSTTESLSESCSQATSANDFKDGVYLLKGPKPDSEPFYVYCIHGNKSEQGWMVIQRREDGSVNFNRNWLDYKLGFGDLDGEYWIGLERLHEITNSRPYELLVFLIDFDNFPSNAKYSEFVVGSEEEGYKLTVGGDNGNIRNSFGYHNSMKFSTFDNDNDGSLADCARAFKGGWWYNDCFECNLNGVYYPALNKNSVSGIIWRRNWGANKFFQYVFMAIRPK